MKKRDFFIFAVYVGIQSFLLQLADKCLSPWLTAGSNEGFAFVAFQGWALYFLLGGKPKGIIKGLLGYAAGIGFAMLMVLIGTWLTFTGVMAVPITALLVVPAMMYFEYGPWWLSNTAVFFIGAGACYGIYNYVDEVTMPRAAVIVMVYCLLGLVSGWATIRFRTSCQAWREGGTDEQLTETYQGK